MKQKELVVIAHNIRSVHNVGSLFRTAEGLGVAKLYLTGYTPYPKSRHDQRLPHVADRAHQQIRKTALGAEKYLAWLHIEDVGQAINRLRASGFRIVALEQTPDSRTISDYAAGPKIALVLGNEPLGVDSATLSLCDDAVEIPMRGQKESLNVVQAAAIAIYQLLS